MTQFPDADIHNQTNGYPVPNNVIEESTICQPNYNILE